VDDTIARPLSVAVISGLIFIGGLGVLLIPLLAGSPPPSWLLAGPIAAAALGVALWFGRNWGRVGIICLGLISTAGSFLEPGARFTITPEVGIVVLIAYLHFLTLPKANVFFGGEIFRPVRSAP